ncbi:zinc-dependent alcohol dehydrogenase family protein [Bordetella trematum]|uniref:zinc-dependent alcohol dehydrogenase family protein n=1 Tax=Bordetella trematum TaxID=123899 RepID=UPI000470D72E|nr:zinc-dependent alcohol dehydrogenase family protein [Bordetella trematum]QIM70338.1 quinone oxidoreductase [Bordetella trematum]
MQAIILTSHGDAGVLQLQEMPRPEVRPGHLLIRMAATSVNQIDIKIRQGLPIGPELPSSIGCDLAGVVEAVGEGVSGFAPGDEVYGCATGVKGVGGSLAEYVVADARLVAPKPRSLSMREAAALPLVGITAWDAMARSGVSQGEHVLVHGGAGGVGHVAIQLAKARGARVATTVLSQESADFARALGADDVIRADQEEVADYVQRLTGGAGFDMVFDTVGGANLDRAFQAACLEGRVAATAARSTHDLSPLHAKALSLYVVFMLIPMLHNRQRERHGRILRELAGLVDAGRLRPCLDAAHFSLAQAGDAHRRLESGSVLGKVVIDIA